MMKITPAARKKADELIQPLYCRQVGALKSSAKDATFAIVRHNYNSDWQGSAL